MGTLAFRNQVQVALWENELKGQLSDGHWENAGPREHYKPWCYAHAIVDPDNLGRDFWARRESYAFASPMLLEAVGDRMLNYARLALAGVPLEDIHALSYCFDIFTGKLVPKMPSGEGEYYDKMRQTIGSYGFDRIDGLLSKTKFEMKDLKRELRDMGKIIKMRRRS